MSKFKGASYVLYTCLPKLSSVWLYVQFFSRYVEMFRFPILYNHGKLFAINVSSRKKSSMPDRGFMWASKGNLQEKFICNCGRSIIKMSFSGKFAICKILKCVRSKVPPPPVFLQSAKIKFRPCHS